MVITNAAHGNPNVKALVYVDAFAPKKGESTLQLDTARPGSALAAPAGDDLQLRALPGCGEGRRRAVRQDRTVPRLTSLTD